MPNLPPRYNVAPTQTLPRYVWRARSQMTFRVLGLVRPGLTLVQPDDQRACRDGDRQAGVPSGFRRRRCLIPADGYQWQVVRRWQAGGASRGRQRSFISPASGALVGRRRQRDQAVPSSTTAAASIAAIHERMPVMLDPADFAGWLRGTSEEAQALLHPYRGALASYPVSPRVNSVRNDDAAVLERVDPPAPPQKAQLDLL
jgi:putative SOS response-associated peptidase YedK